MCKETAVVIYLWRRKLTLVSGCLRCLISTGETDPAITKLLATDKAGKLQLVTITDKLDTTTDFSVAVKVIADFTSRLCTAGGRGLLNSVFHPDYKNNGYIYVTYTNKGDTNCDESLEAGPRIRLSRFKFFNDAVDLSTEKVLLNSARHPNTAHGGGNMSFGKDGHLYVVFGDGHRGSYAQILQTFRGQLLRVTADGGIPIDNPFVGDPKSVRCNELGETPPFSDPSAKCKLSNQCVIADVSADHSVQ